MKIGSISFLLANVILAIPVVAMFNAMMPADQAWYMYLCSGFSAAMVSAIFLSTATNA